MSITTQRFQAVRRFTAYGKTYEPGDVVDTSDWKSGVANKLFNQRRMIPMAGDSQPASAPTPPTDPNAVPEGNIETVMTWVGDDPARAQLALEAEQASETPRKGVVEPLEEMLTQPDNPDDSEDGAGEDAAENGEDGAGDTSESETP